MPVRQELLDIVAHIRDLMPIAGPPQHASRVGAPICNDANWVPRTDMATTSMVESVHQEFDASIVINVHRGRQFLARTMLSFEDAARFARSAGLRIEALFVLDRSDSATVNWVRTYDSRAFDSIRIVLVDFGSLGLSRDHGMRLARGTYVMFGDEDDLVSFNIIAESYCLAQAEGPRCIVIPEYLFGFGTKNFVTRYFGSQHVSPHSFIKYHPFVSRIFVHNSIRDNTRFIDVQLSSGYAYEDWHFNATAYSLGYIFRPAPDTILFYRHRSGLLQSMDAMSTRQIPPSRLFKPQIYRHFCGNSEFVPGGFSQDESDPQSLLEAFIDDPILRELIAAAHAIEPTINVDKLLPAAWITNITDDLSRGKGYLRACEIVGNARFTDVAFLAPTVRKQDTARISDLLNVLRASNPEFRLLVLHPAVADNAATLESIHGAVTITLGALHSGLETIDIDVIALRLLENTAAVSRLHLVPGEFPHRFFSRFRVLLENNSKYYYRFGRFAATAAASHFHATDVFGFISDHIEDLDGVVSCSENAIQFDRSLIDRSREKWNLLRPLVPDLDESSVEIFRRSYRILISWPGALTDEANLLFAVAKQMWHVARYIRIDILAGKDQLPFDTRSMMTCPNLSVFSDSTSAPVRSSYDLILATEEDLQDADCEIELFVLPIVVVRSDAASRHLANKIQSDLVVTIPPTLEQAAQRLVDAILHLYKDSELLNGLKRLAIARALPLHGAEAFGAAVSRIFSASSTDMT